MPVTIDQSGKVVLITGGTKGIGLQTGLMFGQAGGKVYLTHKWGTADEAAIGAQFAEVDAPVPVILPADVKEDDDTKALLETIGEKHAGVDVFISNAAFALVVPTLDDYKKRSLFQTFEYSSWPLVAYTMAMHKRFGRYPKYVIGVSSDGPDCYYPGYDYVAYSKALMEVMAKYLAHHLTPHGSYVNVFRSRSVMTDSLYSTFGEEKVAFLRRLAGDRIFLTPEQCGRSIFAMCSGLMDGFQGQVLYMDNGTHFTDHYMTLYEDEEIRKKLDIG